MEVTWRPFLVEKAPLRFALSPFFIESPMQKNQQTDEFFDVYYDVSETLFDRIRETMDRQTDIEALKMIRDCVVRGVAAIENTDAESIYRDLEDVREMERK